MDFDHLLNNCLSLAHTEETFPFDQDTMVFKVAGKMFALTSLSDWEEGRPSVNLKCNPEKALELREQYAGIEPGYHMNKVHWNTVYLNRDVPDKLVLELIQHSYELVWKSLSKKTRDALS